MYSRLYLNEGEEVEEIHLYTLTLNMNPTKQDCNFSATIAPSFFESRSQCDDPGKWERWLRNFFSARSKIEELSFKIDSKGHLTELVVEFPPKREGEPPDICSITWKDGNCSTSGVRFLDQFTVLLEIFAQNFFHKVSTLAQEKKVIPAPLHIENMVSAPDGGIIIYAAPSFMEGFREMAASNPSYYYSRFKEGFAVDVIKELQKRGKNYFPSMFDPGQLLPHLFYFGKDGYLRCVIAPRAGCDISLGIGGDTKEEIIKREGCFYTPHNLEIVNNGVLATFIFIFWLIAEKVREFHGVDFFPTK